MIRILVSSLVLSSVLVGSALAQDKSDNTDEVELREEMFCFPADGIVEVLSKFDELSEDRKDTVSGQFDAAFIINDGGTYPDRIFMRDGTQETDFTINPDGAVPDFSTLKSASESTEICIQDTARAGLPKDEDAVDLDVDLNIAYNNTSGVHTIEELRDGASDGRKHYKKMIGGLAANLVPKFEYVSLTYDNESLGPDGVAAYKGGTKLEGLTLEPFGKTYVISLDELEDMGADALHIKGGSYMLEPSPSIKTMKRLGFTEEDEE